MADGADRVEVGRRGALGHGAVRAGAAAQPASYPCPAVSAAAYERLGGGVVGAVRVGERGDLVAPPGENVPAGAQLAAGLGGGGAQQVEVRDRVPADLVPGRGEPAQVGPGEVVRCPDGAGDDEEGRAHAVRVKHPGGCHLVGCAVVEREGDDRGAPCGLGAAGQGPGKDGQEKASGKDEADQPPAGP